MINVILNGKTIKTEAGKTVLDIAKEHGLSIPTLCHDEELKPFGSCWVCAVQVKGRRGFVTACGTEIYDGMEITTDSPEIFKARKMALELLLSDHFADCEAPCKIACPDKVDVQSYVALIANGQPHEAVKVIKDRLPMPLSIGRVCPAFCEAECRRTLVEDPISIRQLKRYAADEDLNDHWTYVPPREEDKGKSVAVIGAGPSGLTCGYYLSQRGYDVTVFEASPEPGGWLRYGIPEYRLPKELLQKEIDLMCSNGMKIHTEKALGKDFSLSQISEEYDAVYLALGAQNAVPMNVKGSDLPGCYLGVDYLKEFMLGKVGTEHCSVRTGKKVAVVGGGNTAIDCARTARRLGAEVTIIYRRTRKEMPAEAYEVDAAEEEGIKFHFLTNPVEYKGDESGIKEIVCETMRLGEPDSSGRRRPEPTGEYFTEEYDTVIAAISQIPEVALFAEEENKIGGKTLPLSRWSTAEVDEKLLYTGLNNIFAGGDFRVGPATAIEAIADGRQAADNIDKYLQHGHLNKDMLDKDQFCSMKAKKLKEINKIYYSLYAKADREKMPELDHHIRSGNFEEVELGYSHQQAKFEAERCLECGCMVNSNCDLRDQATEYGVDNSLFFGEVNQHPIDDSHPFILRDANKCIKCGRCVRICSEIQGAGVLGYIYRGFTTVVAPEFGESLTKTACESCGKCITVCPVGALVEKNIAMKRYPLEDRTVPQNCGLCGTGCKVDVHVSDGNVSYVSAPEEQDFNKRNICFYGRFGWQAFNNDNMLKQPMVKTESGWKAIEWDEAAKIIKEQKNILKDINVSIGAGVSNEELVLMHEIANRNSSTLKSMTFAKLFTDDLFDTFANTCSYEDLESAENIFLVGNISHTLRTLCRQHQRKGKKLAILNREESRFDLFADCACHRDDYTEALIEMKDKHIFMGSQEDDSMFLSEKTLFIYNRNDLTEEEMFHLWDLASIICSFTEGSGVLETAYWSNLKGFRKIVSYEPVDDESLIISYGEELCKFADKVAQRYLISVSPHFDNTCQADMVLPKPTYLEIEGTAISDDGAMRKYHNPVKSNKFDLLLRLFKDAGLLSDLQVEPSIWVNKTEQLLAQKGKPKVFKRKELVTFLEKVIPVHKSPQDPFSPHWKYMKELQDSCKE